jgi:transcriptional regulator with XRE-family HTH domain
MKRSLYGERDYAFSQMMLTLRTTIGLTQAGLAELLGVTRRAMAEWEAGSAYPKTEHLKQVIALGVQQQAFLAGRPRRSAPSGLCIATFCHKHCVALSGEAALQGTYDLQLVIPRPDDVHIREGGVADPFTEKKVAHWIIVQDGWGEVAASIYTWLAPVV